MNSRSGRTPQRRLPREARVHRAGGGSGKAASFFKSLAFVGLGIAIVFGIGWWATGGKLPETPSKAKPAATDNAKPASNSSQTGAAQPAPTTAPPVQQPPTQPTKTDDAANQAIIAERAHIDRAGTAKETMLIKVFYADGLTNDTALQPVEIRVPRSVSLVKVVAEQVVQAPENLRLYSNVPVGTKVQSTNLKDGVAIIDLSREAANVQGSASASNMIASFVYSLTEVPNVKAVQLLVNGRPAILHGIEWTQPKTREEVRNLFAVQPVIKFAAR